MTSFLIVSRDPKKRAAFCKEFCEKHEIDRFDQTVITRETNSKTSTQSIGIETIKLMQKKLFLKPVKSQTKAVILEEAHLLTTEAQNALLKVLEEPPENTMILLSADSKESLLPTILSRCQILEIQKDQTKLTEKEEITLKEFLTGLPTLSTGDRLKKAEQLAKDKEKAITWLGKVIIVSRQMLLQEVLSDDAHMEQTAETIDQLQSLYTILKTTNANPRFAIENTLLSCNQ